jgi:signal peptidase
MARTRARRFLRLGGYVVLAFLIGVSIFAVAEYATGTPPFYVVTDNPSSMSPTLNYGDVGVLYKTGFSALAPGAIIAFHDPRGNPTIIVHRVVSVLTCGGATCLVTKGDNQRTNPDNDPWNVTEQDYVGQVVLTVPYAGYLSPALWGFNGYYALLPVSVILIGFVFWDVTSRKSQKDEMGGARP